ncbi:hypothetical protein N399_10790 [Bacillus licheniformis CG-B52]|nr:hypothetical protein N399_10790 [Bacillus licheniformis CG-B52]KUL13114.1 hypothetical protein LI17339_02465 [Bacillus licheniformis LMG 17339]
MAAPFKAPFFLNSISRRDGLLKRFVFRLSFSFLI